MAPDVVMVQKYYGVSPTLFDWITYTCFASARFFTLIIHILAIHCNFRLYDSYKRLLTSNTVILFLPVNTQQSTAESVNIKYAKYLHVYSGKTLFRTSEMQAHYTCVNDF